MFRTASDLEANYQNWGLFVRGTAVYDTWIMDKRNDNDDFRPSQGYPNTVTSRRPRCAAAEPTRCIL